MEVKKNVSLKEKNTLGIDSYAEFYSEVETESELKEAIKFAKDNNVSLRVLGLGSNVLLPTGTLKGLIVVINNKKVEISDDGIVGLGAGAILGSVIQTLAEKNYDLSPFVGYPSTVGGAVVGNSGTMNIGFGDYLVSAVIYDANTGEKEQWVKETFIFDYRYSALKEEKNKIFWEAEFKFPEVDNVKEKMAELLKERIEKQPKGKSAGCFFRNTENFSAGYLIDQCGLKGKKIGGAEVSEKHANFFVNSGEATSGNFMKLIELARTQVKARFGLDLQLEIEIFQ